ncbi:MAG: hypothetical protein FWD46_04355 [Cystobacterineae bacterium]|nr:hypothetical protein [Cystobacterineae bacterium]
MAELATPLARSAAVLTKPSVIDFNPEAAVLMTPLATDLTALPTRLPTLLTAFEMELVMPLKKPMVLLLCGG